MISQSSWLYQKSAILKDKNSPKIGVKSVHLKREPLYTVYIGLPPGQKPEFSHPFEPK
jgi:hypothetical protein